MSEAVQKASPYLDETWRRIAWIARLAVVVWVTLLTGFALLLEQTAPPPVELKPLEARFLELPPAGLQGGPSAPARPAPHVGQKAKLRVVPTVKPVSKHHEAKPVLEVPAAPEGTAKSPAAAPQAASDTSTESGSAVAGATAHAAAPDSAAIAAERAPTPSIPEDMRENAYQAVALAHFKVSYGGDVQVSLTQPTTSPRLNQILLDTLQQWPFFPAMKNGVAIDSEFDLRIPISIQ
jgi:protein TonB